MHRARRFLPLACAALAVVLLHRLIPSLREAFIALPVLATGAALWRAAHHPRRGRSAWLLLALALALLTLAPAVDALSGGGASMRVESFPTVPWVLYLLSYPVLLIAAVKAGALRGPRRDVISWIDGAGVGIATGLPLYVFWFGPAWRETAFNAPTVIAATAGPLMALVLIAAGTRVLLGAGRWNAPSVLLFIGLVCAVAGDFMFNLLIVNDAYTPGATADVGFLLACLFWSAAALHHDAPAIVDRGPRKHGVAAHWRLACLGIAAVLPVLTIAIAHVQARPIAAEVIFVPVAVMVVLLGIRLALLARWGSRSWSGALLLGLAGLLLILVAWSLTQAQTSSDRQRKIANDLLYAKVSMERLDAFGARMLATPRELSPQEIAGLTREVTAIGTAISAMEPEANGIRRSELKRYYDRFTDGLVLALRYYTARNLVALERLGTTTLYPSYEDLSPRFDLAAVAYRDGAARAAQRGRIGSVIVLLLSLVALTLLVLRFGVMRRSAQVAEAQNRAVWVSEQRIRALIDASPDVITVVDADTRILAHPEPAERVLGYEAGHMLGRRLADLVSAEDAAALRGALRELPPEPGAGTMLTLLVRHADGSLIETEASIVNRVDEEHIGGYVLNLRDVTERKLLEARIEHQTLHDPLTGLPNRGFVEQRLRETIVHGTSGAPVHAMLLLDLHDFKAINDTFGHATGDALLVEVAGRLRESVAGADLLARVGGDEFAVLLDGVDSPAEAVTVAQAIVNVLLPPIDLGGGHLQPVRVSVGVAVSEGSNGGTAAQRAEHLLRNAELAMYEAKRRDSSEVELFVDEMHAAVAKRLELRTELERAIKEDQLVLHYQPIIDLHGMRISGYEALVRWIHPQRGMVSPGDFIPIAEESGLIVDLGSWVLREACRQTAEWRRDWPADRYVSVNVAGQQLQRGGFPGEVAGVLRDAGLPARLLLLEVTETGLIGDTEGSGQRLDELREIGTRLAIDDFGTGYSSLSYLHRFPFDVLKIDKSFIDRVTTEEAGHTLVEAMVRMAASLNLKVVAEGIEDPDQVQALLRMDCELGQGFYFSRPLKAADVPAFSLPGDAEPQRVAV